MAIGSQNVATRKSSTPATAGTGSMPHSNRPSTANGSNAPTPPGLGLRAATTHDSRYTSATRASVAVDGRPPSADVTSSNETTNAAVFSPVSTSAAAAIL